MRQMRTALWAKMLVMAATGAAFCAMAPPTIARGADRSEVTANGKSVLKMPPQILRMTLTFTAEGKDMKEAVANLAKTREEAKAKLQSLEADAKSIKFGDVTAGNGTDTNDPQQRQMRQYMQMMQRQQGKKAPTTGPATVTVSTTLTAEWPLKSAAADANAADGEWLIAATALQDKVKAAFAKPSKPLTPEEQEVMEEMQNNGGMQDTGEMKPGEPAFVFVRPISDDEIAKATAEAFDHAKTEAARLAAAAGAQLGRVAGLTANASAGTDQSRNAMSYYYAQALGQTVGGEPLEGRREAIGASASAVTYTVVVSVSFELK